MLIESQSLVEVAHVTAVTEAEEVARRFNAFHDGILKELVLLSDDEIDSTGTQSCTGDFSLRLTFARHNFLDAKHGYQQCIQAVFLGVRDLCLRCSGEPVDWSIAELTFSSIVPIASAAAIAELACAISVYGHDQKTVSKLTVLSFAFAEATFSEGKLAGPLKTFE